MIQVVKGFKVFNSDWTCRGFQYTCPGTFEEDVIPFPCDRGFHFCKKASDCFNYYRFDPNNKVAEVIALGEVATEGDKSCTNKIQLVREIPWAELLEIVNTGKACSGLCNSGDWNSGDWNSGDRNSGDWNRTSFSAGCFCTEEPKILLFNKPSNWTMRDWLNSDARYILNSIPASGSVLEYVYFSDMTDEEKAEHPEAETTGGYLKILNKAECGQSWWDGLSPYRQQIIKNIPNFDSKIFKEITGIDVI